MKKKIPFDYSLKVIANNVNVVFETTIKKKEYDYMFKEHQKLASSKTSEFMINLFVDETCTEMSYGTYTEKLSVLTIENTKAILKKSRFIVGGVQQ